MNLIFTKTTYDLKRKELSDLQQKIEALREDMTTAREQGDLSENFGYVEARKQLDTQSVLFKERTEELAGAQIVDPEDWCNLDMEGFPRAMLGARITILRKDKEETLLVGGAGDNFPHVVPYNSPLGKALIPKAQGKTVELDLGGEVEEIKILRCEVPTLEQIKSTYAPVPEKKPTPVKKKNPAQDELEPV